MRLVPVPGVFRPISDSRMLACARRRRPGVREEDVVLVRAESTNAPLPSSAVDVETAIRTRRTHKVYGPEPVDRATLEELLDVARWAPNHHLTNPWRFRVIGPRTLDALKAAAGPEAAPKLDRAPTLIAVTALLQGDPVEDEEDLHATACATYALLLAAHGRGLAGYWRTPGVLRTPDGRTALGLADTERVVALVHLGTLRQERPAPDRAPLADVARFLP